MHIEQQPQYLVVRFDYNERIVSDLKKIGGGWRPDMKAWLVSWSRYDELMTVYSKYVKPEKVQAPEQYGTIPDLPELDIELPLKRALFHYQAQGAAYNIVNKRTILGDQPGLGKTSQAIASAIGCQIKYGDASPILVVCPASLRMNWQKEFMTVAGMKSVIMTDSIRNTFHTYNTVAGIQVFIINYEGLKKFFVESIDRHKDPDTGKDKKVTLKDIHFNPKINFFKTVIIDEIHRCKDGGTQTSKFVMGVTKGKEYVFGLTGTPVVNKPKDLISQLYIINRLNEFGGYKGFINRYCDGGKGASNSKELSYRLKTTCFYQRAKKDVLKDLPDKMRQIIYSEITTQA